MGSDSNAASTDTEYATTRSSPPVLRRSRTDRVLFGVCGGVGHYLGVDPLLVRIALVVLVVAGFGTGILLYLAGWLLIPEEGRGEITHRARSPTPETLRVLAGAALVAVGVVLLFAEIVPWIADRQVIAALLLVGVGAVLLVRGPQR